MLCQYVLEKKKTILTEYTLEKRLKVTVLAFALYQALGKIVHF